MEELDNNIWLTECEVFSSVNRLNEIQRIDKMFSVEPFDRSLMYEINLNANFEDKNAYISAVSKHIEEAEKILELVNLLIFSVILF